MHGRLFSEKMEKFKILNDFFVTVRSTYRISTDGRPIKQLIRVCGFLSYLKIVIQRSNYRLCALIHVEKYKWIVLTENEAFKIMNF